MAKQAGTKPHLVTLDEVAKQDPKMFQNVTGRQAIPGVDAHKIASDLLARLGDLSGVRIFGARIMVVKFIRDTIGSSGKLLAAAQTQMEDQYQGKVGLCIKVGRLAFKTDAKHDWGEDQVQVGDWVLYGYGDGYDMDIQPYGTDEKIHCKVLDESEVKGLVPNPGLIW